MTPSRASQVDDGTIATSNLALASVLSMYGYHYTLAREGNVGTWQFDGDERMKELSIEFNAGECRVEPVAFMKSLKQVREELYRCLGIESPRDAG